MLFSGSTAMEKTSIEDWLAEMEDIPFDPDSEDHDDEGYPNVAAGSYIVVDDRTLEVDYLDHAQPGDEIPLIIINEVEFKDNRAAQEINLDILEGNNIDIPLAPMDVDEDSEPLASRMYILLWGMKITTR